MKYLTMFEKFTIKPFIWKTNKSEFKIGDYVIGVDVEYLDYNIKNFFENNVGQIKRMDKSNFYYMKYDIVPDYIPKYVSDGNGLYPLFGRELRLANEQEIEEQMIKNNAKKYNL